MIYTFSLLNPYNKLYRTKTRCIDNESLKFNSDFPQNNQNRCCENQNQNKTLF